MTRKFNIIPRTVTSVEIVSSSIKPSCLHLLDPGHFLYHMCMGKLFVEVGLTQGAHWKESSPTDLLDEQMI